MEIRQFQGLLVGNTPTQAMLEESRLVFHAFAAGNNMLREVMDIKVALLKKAEAEFDTAKENGQQESIKIARKAIAKARAEGQGYRREAQRPVVQPHRHRRCVGQGQD